MNTKYILVSDILLESSKQEETETKAEKYRLKHHLKGLGSVGVAGGIYGGLKERHFNLQELNKVEEEWLKTPSRARWLKEFQKTEHWKRYRRNVRKAIAKGAAKKAIIFMLAYAFYAFLNESIRHYKKAEKKD